MNTITSPQALQAQCLAWKREGKTIALVPTMGFFHEGHESLMRAVRPMADKLIVTLFVNPTQFGPTEDLAAYPRDAAKDSRIAEANGADILFAPQPESMYSPDHATWVEVPALAAGLCAIARPTHFRGVTTVVTKLFLLSQADVAAFGEKDWQQLAIIRRLVRDLNFPVSIVGVPISREEDGLARSSRNAYLTAEERALAPHFHKGLLLAQRMAREGETSCAALREAVLEYWRVSIPLGEVDYCSFIHPEDMTPVSLVEGPTRLACAMRIGKARILDNIVIKETLIK